MSAQPSSREPSSPQASSTRHQSTANAAANARSANELSAADMAAWERDGYLLVRGLFDPQEMQSLLHYAKNDQSLMASAYGRKDATGQETKLALWNHPTDDLYGLFSRSPRIVDRMEQLLGGEVYHYHSKMMLKEPLVGGAWEWHQDYGYWYHNGCLAPLLASCLIAVDRATKENGCLQVLKRSHLLGRMDHGKVGDQTGADPERVAAALERLKLVYCELEPGAAIFFHANTLHRSDQNKSEHPRWAFIACYNTKHNDPYKDSKHPRYNPLDVWDDSRVAEIGRRQWEEMK